MYAKENEGGRPVLRLWKRMRDQLLANEDTHLPDISDKEIPKEDTPSLDHLWR